MQYAVTNGPTSAHFWFFFVQQPTPVETLTVYNNLSEITISPWKSSADVIHRRQTINCSSFALKTTSNPVLSLLVLSDLSFESVWMYFNYHPVLIQLNRITWQSSVSLTTYNFDEYEHNPINLLLDHCTAAGSISLSLSQDSQVNITSSTFIEGRFTAEINSSIVFDSSSIDQANSYFKARKQSNIFINGADIGTGISLESEDSSSLVVENSSFRGSLMGRIDDTSSFLFVNSSFGSANIQVLESSFTQAATESLGLLDKEHSPSVMTSPMTNAANLTFISSEFELDSYIHGNYMTVTIYNCSFGQLNSATLRNLTITPLVNAQVSIQKSFLYDTSLRLQYRKCDYDCFQRGQYQNGFEKIQLKGNVWEYSGSIRLMNSPLAAIVNELLPTIIPPIDREYVKLLDATRNYWGSPDGPDFCGHHAGSSIFISQFVDASFYCTTPSCDFFSSIRFHEDQLVYGCDMIISESQKVIIEIFAVSSLLISIGSIIFFSYSLYRAFSESERIRQTPEEALHKVIRLTFGMLTCSSICSGLCILGLIQIIFLKSESLPLPGQHNFSTIEFSLHNILIISSFLILTVNVIFVLICFNRHRYPSKFPIAVLVCLALQSIFVCSGPFAFITITISSQQFNVYNSIFKWINGQYLPSLWSIWTYIFLVSTTLYSLISFLGIYFLNNIVSHFDYFRLTTTAEKSQIPKLTSSPKVESLAKRLRISIVVSGSLAILEIILSSIILDSVVKNLFDDMGNENPKLIPIIVACTTAVTGLLVLLLAFFLSFYYTRVIFLTFIIAVLAFPFVSQIAEVAFSVTKFQSAIPLDISRYCVEWIWLASLCVCLYFLLRFRSLILKEIPRSVQSNINDHLDDQWGVKNDNPDGHESQDIASTSPSYNNSLSASYQHNESSPLIPQ